MIWNMPYAYRNLSNLSDRLKNGWMYRVVVICPKNSLYSQFRKEADFTTARQVLFYIFSLLIGNCNRHPSTARFISTSYHAFTETYQICVLCDKPCLDMGNLLLSLKCALIRRHFDLRRKRCIVTVSRCKYLTVSRCI